MGVNYNTNIVNDGLTLYLDAANVKSYPGILGNELVVTSTVTQIDGTTYNVVRDAVQNVSLVLGLVVAGKTYYVDYLVTSYTGTVGASFRINNSGANLTPTVSVSGAGRFNAKFTAGATGTLSITGDNSGTNFLVDYVSVREVLSGTGTRWFDLSGVGNNGTLTNGPTFDSNNNGSISFDGTDDCIVLNSDVLVSTTAPFTVYLWMNHNPRTTGTLFHRMLTLRSDATQPLGIAFVNANSNGYSGLYLTAASDWVKGSNGYYPTTNTWGLLTLTYNGLGSTTGTNFKMYWNAVDIGFTANPSAGAVSINNESFMAGRRSTTDDQYYRGKLSNFMLYNVEHTSSQISKNYEALRGRYGI